MVGRQNEKGRGNAYRLPAFAAVIVIVHNALKTPPLLTYRVFYVIISGVGIYHAGASYPRLLVGANMIIHDITFREDGEALPPAYATFHSRVYWSQHRELLTVNIRRDCEVFGKEFETIEHAANHLRRLAKLAPVES